MWQGVRREAGSAHTTYESEEEGAGGPPAQALGEREQRSRQWIASLAEGDRVNAVGERSSFKKFRTHTQDHGDEYQRERGECCLRTLVDRKRKCLSTRLM